MSALTDLNTLGRVHQGADVALHCGILFGDLLVAGRPFFDLYNECMRQTQTSVGSWKVFRRAQRAFVLAKYLEHAASLSGAKIECGVFRGFSALLACRIQQAIDPSFRGAEFFLLDSFEGLSAPRDEDKIDVTLPDGATGRVASHAEKHFAESLQAVSTRFTGFPDLTFVKGWVPGAFSALPECAWSFVHVDVDLFEPTLACLEYFHPRMVPGGVILNDDFASPLFPGGGKAWAAFFDPRQIPYVVLDTGQSIYLKPG